MAVAPTGNIFKALSFDNVSSRTYGVYITGEAVYNAPEREVEMISIPGRNGAFALDKGRFENIEVTYPAGIFADNEANFAEAISDFRNFLCSRNGYVRLSDEYNPNEYRMAVYKSGLEVSPALLKAGEFEITFDCKPQRFLTSGETEVTVSSGGTLTNPTLFESSPLLKVEGYGDINVGEYVVQIENTVLGNVELAPSSTSGMTSLWYTSDYSENLDLLNNGDNITLTSFQINSRISLINTANKIKAVTVTRTSSQISSFIGCEYNSGNVIVRYGSQTFTKGNTTTELTDTFTLAVTYTDYWGDNPVTETITFNVKIRNEGSNKLLKVCTSNWSNVPEVMVRHNYDIISLGNVTGYSTTSILGHPTYIDCDIGAAYRIENGRIVSLNGSIDLGSNLPELVSGSNAITYSNTITSLKVVPRWWKV